MLSGVLKTYMPYIAWKVLSYLFLILSISLPPHDSCGPNCPLLLNSSTSRLWSRETFHLLILCNCPLFAIVYNKIINSVVTVLRSKLLLHLRNTKIAKFNTLQFYFFPKNCESNSSEIWLMIFRKILVRIRYYNLWWNTVANLVSLTDVFVSSRSNPFVGEQRCVTRQKWLGGRETMAT